MIELYFIYNGHRKILIGSFGHIHSAINELKKHQASYSAISHPRFRKSMSGENIRIDYGAVDCYYLITRKRRKRMARDILTDLAFENLYKSVALPDWKEPDEVILVSLANKEQIESDERYRLTENCRFFGDRICIFCEQVKKNNYITLHKSMLEKIIKVMETFKEVENL